MAKIQTCFEVWLVGIFFNAVMQIGMALIQITSNAVSSTTIEQLPFYTVTPL